MMRMFNGKRYTGTVFGLTKKQAYKKAEEFRKTGTWYARASQVDKYDKNSKWAVFVRPILTK